MGTFHPRLLVLLLAVATSFSASSAALVDTDTVRRVRLQTILLQVPDSNVTVCRKVVIIISGRRDGRLNLSLAPNGDEESTLVTGIDVETVNEEEEEEKLALRKEMARRIEKMLVAKRFNDAKFIPQESKLMVEAAIKEFMEIGEQTRHSLANVTSGSQQYLNIKLGLRRRQDKLLKRLRTVKLSEVIRIVQKKAKRTLRKIRDIRKQGNSSSSSLSEKKLTLKIRLLCRLVVKLRARVKLTQKISIKAPAKVAAKVLKQKARKIIREIELVKQNIRLAPPKSKAVLRRAERKLKSKLQKVKDRLSVAKPGSVPIPKPFRREVEEIAKKIVVLDATIKRTARGKTKSELRARRGGLMDRLRGMKKKLVSRAIKQRIWKIFQRLKTIQKRAKVSNPRIKLGLKTKAEKLLATIHRLRKIAREVKRADRAMAVAKPISRQKVMKLIEKVVKLKKQIWVVPQAVKAVLKRKVNSLVQKLRQVKKAVVAHPAAEDQKRRVRDMIQRLLDLEEEMRVADVPLRILMRIRREKLLGELRTTKRRRVLKWLQRDAKRTMRRIRGTRWWEERVPSGLRLMLRKSEGRLSAKMQAMRKLAEELD